MAISIIENLRNPDGVLQELFLDVDGPSSYATGGQTINATDVGLRQIHYAAVEGSDNAGHVVFVRPSAKGQMTSIKLVWVVVGTGAELGAGQNVSGRFVKVRVIGR